MTRTVKVALQVDEAQFVRGMGRAEKATADLAAKADAASGAADELAAGAGKASEQVTDMGDSAKGAGRKVNGLREDAARLDRQIKQTADSVRDLARQIAHATDEAERADLSEKLKVERGRLRDQVDLRKLIDFEDAGRDGAGKFSLAFSQKIGPLLAKAPLSPALVGAAALAAPFVADVLAGAVVGAIGGGAVAAGIALAAQDSRVQAEAKGLGAEIAAIFNDAAAPFVPATIGALGIVRQEIHSLDDDFAAIFDDAAGYVEPLTRGVVGFVRELVPGIRDAVAAGEPFFDMLVAELPELGGDVAELFGVMADHAEDGAAAVGAMLDTMGVLVDTTGFLVDGLGAVVDVVNAIESATRLGPAEPDRVLKKIGQSSGPAADGIHRVADAADELERSAASATVKVETLDAMIARMSGDNISAERASIALEAAIDRAGEAAGRSGDGIDRNTEAGRRNRQALVDIADAAWTSHDAILATTGSSDLAAQATERGRAAFLKMADAMGVDAAEAKRLADQLFGIPSINRKVTVDTGSGKAAVEEFIRRLNGIKDQSVTIHGYVRWTSSGLKVPGGTILAGNRHGGVYEHAQVGVLREAQIASPMAPARYAWAEPATGGEAFIPRFGDTARSMAILERAASWYGAEVRRFSSTPAISVATSAAQPSAGMSPAQVAQAIRAGLTGLSVHMDGQKVGRIQGRAADLLSR